MTEKSQRAGFEYLNYFSLNIYNLNKNIYQKIEDFFKKIKIDFSVLEINEHGLQTEIFAIRQDNHKFLT